VSADPNPLDNLRRAAEELAVEVSSLVPRLVDRSREQLAIAMSFAERLPCAGWFGLGGDGAPPRPDLHVVDDLDDEDDDLLEPAPRPPAAPAKAAAPKKAAPKKAAAKKAAPKKAAAKKAAAKTAATTGSATKAAAKKKATAKKAAPKKAAKKSAPTPTTDARTEPTPPPSPAPAPPETPSPATVRAATEGALAIPDYDELAASQVIPRLDSLSPEELESIRRHEASHRSRRTILSRVAQLQAG
jgi:hypothetical protein